MRWTMPGVWLAVMAVLASRGTRLRPGGRDVYDWAERLKRMSGSE